MTGFECVSGGWLWIIPFGAMMLFCFFMMVGGKMGSMKSIAHNKAHHLDADSAIDIADKRYASGEIGKDDHEKILNRLKVDEPDS